MFTENKSFSTCIINIGHVRVWNLYSLFLTSVTKDRDMKLKGAVAFDDMLGAQLKNPKAHAAYEEEAFFSKIAMEIVRLREEQQMSQKDLADAMRTTQQAISRIENGDENLTIKTVFKIAQALQRKPQLKFI